MQARGVGKGTALNPDSSEAVSHLVLPGVVGCFFLSGFAALLYQTAWLRQFSIVFGTSELAVATVLAAYMGGLAIGAAIAGRHVHRVRRPVLAYGLLEAGIALSALAVPLLLQAAGKVYAGVLGGQPAPPDAAAVGQSVFYLGVGFAVLALPTGFMGATLPLLIRHAVRRNADVGPRVAALYAVNTFGAVVGTVVAGFVLLPALGLIRTVFVGVLVNLSVFLIAATIAKRTAALDVQPAPIERSGPPGLAGRVRDWRPLWPSDKARLDTAQAALPWIMPLMLVSGANAFLYEVLWTRLLTHVLGGSVQAFATMLAAFLTGIALGAWLAARPAAQRQRAAAAFALVQGAIAACSAAVYAWMGFLVPEMADAYRLALYAVVVLLPGTIFIGATFPLAVRVLAGNEREASTATARIYSWNTVGAISGAVLAAFVLIPALGFAGVIKLAVSVNLAIALLATLLLMRPRPIPAATASLALVIALLLYDPARPQLVVAATAFPVQLPTAAREVFFEVGRSSTVVLLEEDGYHYLRTNGLPEATIPPEGGVPDLSTEKWLTALPAAARPSAANMLVIGLGGGVALEGVPASVGEIHVVELEPAVIAANRALTSGGRADPLADPRVEVIINDARNALRLTDRRYDLIVSQPSHPWTAAASHLFTREFLAEAKSHLSADGVFVQWIGSEFLDERLLRSLAATIAAEFEHVRLYQPLPRALMFLASDASLDVERRFAERSSDLPHFARIGITSAEDLLVALALDEPGVELLAAGAPISTDDENLMATHSRPRADGLMLADLLELFAPHDPLTDPAGRLHEALPRPLNFDYIARRLIRLQMSERAERLARSAPTPADSLLIQGSIHESYGLRQRADAAFLSALRTDPGNLQARFHLIEDRMGSLNRGETSEALRSIASGLSGSAAAVLEGWNRAAAGDWLSLTDLDDALAATRTTDAWYGQAARLRAAWRVQMRQDRRRFASEALSIIDSALFLESDSSLYLMRAQCAAVLQDSDLIIESARLLTFDMGRTLQATRSVPRVRLEEMRRNLQAITRQLGGELAQREPARTAPILSAARELLAHIDELAGSASSEALSAPF